MALHGGPWRGLQMYRRFLAKYTKASLCGANVVIRREPPLRSAIDADNALNEDWDWSWLGFVSWKQHSYREGFYEAPYGETRRLSP
jgi:hypothetical protein